MTDPETIRVYDARAAEYDRLVDADRETPDATLAAFIAALPEGGTVLDLGCGPGRSAMLLVRAGMRVEAWDASAEMVARAARHDGVVARQAVFEDLQGDALFDGVWANFSLLHADRGAMADIVSRIATALRPGGVVHIALKTGDGEARDRLGRFYTYWREAPLAALLEQAGLRPGRVHRGVDRGLDGSDAAWFSMLAHG
ncbi:class I SAM-dependent methyltransferase [Cognatishimia sp. F0-27]|uniref:class I SAM-dependent DNA methyltransferase n=1 Tax=Cognatishimia sp. F0-27 TaxID=2816855 RepID=UPI001D0BFDAC|nr:class I SAM-dependent methyltransferase [Cognatishimia sp. F0-27]MCC1491021.1 class I SAM-dependent methyltransferase [Cognatishimia sp. F0-27]